MIHFSLNHTLDLHQNHIGQNVSSNKEFRLHNWLPGYSAILDGYTLHELVRRDPGVVFVENVLSARAVEPVNVTESRPAPNNSTHTLHKRYTTVESPDSPWNLQMIGAKGRLPTPVKRKDDYLMLSRSGAGVNIYILDSGIRTTHSLFRGRAFNFRNMTHSPYIGLPMDDVVGHGTHVAGIAGSLDFGVAQWATLVNVKVLDNNLDTNLGIVSDALNDIVDEHNGLKGNAISPDGYIWRGGVINMSLGGAGYSIGFAQAVERVVEAGLSIVTSAGNSNRDAGNYYPCAFTKELPISCVGSVDNSYKKSSFSNYGDAVNIVAPGSDIESLDCESDFDTVIHSGTSMATPHVAGILANIIYWEGFNENFYTTALADRRVHANTFKNIVDGFPGRTPEFASSGIQHPHKIYNEPVSCASH